MNSRENEHASTDSAVNQGPRSVSQHTPGPWVLDEVRTDSGRAFRIGAGEMLRAGKGCCIIYDDHGHGDNERKANARLIAAAPELLIALQSAAHALDCLHPDGGQLVHPTPKTMIETTLAIVDAAIAKATGGKP